METSTLVRDYLTNDRGASVHGGHHPAGLTFCGRHLHQLALFAKARLVLFLLFPLLHLLFPFSLHFLFLLLFQQQKRKR